MRRITWIAIAILTTVFWVLIGHAVFAQGTPPSGTKQLTTNQGYINPVDSAIWWRISATGVPSFYYQGVRHKEMRDSLNKKEDIINKATSISLGASDVLYPTQRAVKKYVDNNLLLTTSRNNSYNIVSPNNISTKKYLGFGIGVNMNGALMHFSREGTKHMFDGTAGMVLFTSRTLGNSWNKSNVLFESGYDIRNYGGGKINDSTLIVFYAKYNSSGVIQGLFALRSSNSGASYSTISISEINGCTDYSPYGPLVILPSGKILQTIYGSVGSVSKVWTVSSTDGGLTWGTAVNVVTGNITDNFVTEGAFLSMENSSADGTTKLVGIIRREEQKPIQVRSEDGGATWVNDGEVVFATPKDVSPWVVLSGAGGAFTYVWADRLNFQIKCANGLYDQISTGTNNYTKIRSIYKSIVLERNGAQQGDFGYPSHILTGNGYGDNLILFHDFMDEQPEPSGETRATDIWSVPITPRPYIEAVRASSFSVSQNVSTALELDSVILDTDGQLAADSATIIANQTGVFSYSINVEMNPGGTSTFNLLYAVKVDNIGSEATITQHGVAPSSVNFINQLQLSQKIFLRRGEGIKFYLYQNGSSPLGMVSARVQVEKTL